MHHASHVHVLVRVAWADIAWADIGAGHTALDRVSRARWTDIEAGHTAPDRVSRARCHTPYVVLHRHHSISYAS